MEFDNIEYTWDDQVMCDRPEEYAMAGEGRSLIDMVCSIYEQYQKHKQAWSAGDQPAINITYPAKKH